MYLNMVFNIRNILPFGLIAIFALTLGYSPAAAQSVGEWEPNTSFISTNEIVQDRDGNFLISTDGGIYIWNPNGSADFFTALDGLYRLSPTAMTYDADAHKLWLGFNDGTIQSLDLQRFTWRSYDDIRRNQNFANRLITQMQLIDGELVIATQFGLVVFDVDRGLVNDSYVNLGEYTRGTAANSFYYNNGVFYVATPLGLAIGDRSQGSLAVPANWDNTDGAGSWGTLNENIQSVVVRGDEIFAGGQEENFLYDSQSWSATGLFTQPVERFRKSTSGSIILGLMEDRVQLLNPNNSRNTQQISSEFARSVFYNDSPDNRLFILGTQSRGLALKTNLSSSEFEFYSPPGPDLNFFRGISIRNGEVISASTSIPGQRSAPISNSGYFIKRDNQWVNFNITNQEVLRDFSYNSVYRSLITDDYYFFASFGRGLAKHNKETDEIQIFNVSNSPISPFNPGGNFTVIGGIDQDSRGRVWLAMYVGTGSRMLEYNIEESSWREFSQPTEAGNGLLRDLYIDRRDQFWIPLEGASGAGSGLLVTSFDEEGNQTAIRLTTNQNQGNLPNDQVYAVTEDLRGEVWIGTARGVARFLFPDRVIDGGPRDREASFLINADPDADSPFLLRDINATSIAVNAANQKWIGSRGDGLWLIDENGRNILKHFTTENSPLFSNTIDDVAVDNETGMVYIATDEGLLTYTDIPQSSRRQMDDLFVYPNPYQYNRETGNIIIEGLSDETLVSIISVDGRMINRLNARSGRAEWNARDFNGNRVASGVYMIIANDANGDERGVGKVAIIR